MIERKFFPEFNTESDQIKVGFPETPDLFPAIGAYHAGALIDAFRFAAVIRRLRGEMLARRNN